MPVYFHEKIDQIEFFIQQSKYRIFKISVSGESVLEIKNHDVEIYYNETFNYLGSYPDYYIHIGDANKISNFSAKVITDNIIRGKNEGFILFGYNDGGVFSVTGSKMPFQEAAREVPDWRCFDEN